MGKSQRLKGANGERELVNLLKDELGIDFSRNLNQARDGGHDVNGLALAIEVKRQQKLSLSAWWKQTVEQSNGQVPMLAYRVNYQPWKFVIPLDVLMGVADWPTVKERKTALYQTATVYLDGFCYWVRENLEWLEK